MQLAAWVWQKETDSWVQEEKQAAEEAPPIFSFIYLFILFLSLLSSFALFWENLKEPLGEQRKRGWERTAGTAAATVLRLYGP